MTEPKYDDGPFVHTPSVQEQTRDALLRIEELLKALVAELPLNALKPEHNELQPVDLIKDVKPVETPVMKAAKSAAAAPKGRPRSL